MEELNRQLAATPEQNAKEIAASEQRRDGFVQPNRHDRRTAAAMERLEKKLAKAEAAMMVNR